MSFESNFSNVCRTCLAQSINMKSVFAMEEHQILLSDMLMYFTSLQVLKGDGLPEHICEQCAYEMNRAFLFRKMCEKSDSTLRQCVQIPLPDLNNCFVKNNGKGQTEEVDIGTSENAIDDGGGGNEKYDERCEDSYQENILEGKNTDNLYYENKKVCKNEFESLENEHKKKLYPCKLCETSCLGLAQYRRHMTKIHGEIFKCDICFKEFASGAALKRHLVTHPLYSTDENCPGNYKSKSLKHKTGIIKKRNLPRTCNICNKTFRFHSNLERHKLIHTGEKPYLCNVCGKGFAQLSYLKIHSFIHTGEKPYKCKMCERSFAAPGTLMTHVRTHTGERPHVCKICGKDFPQSGYLSAHIRTHTGEKPVECKVCNRRFNQSGRLIIHMRIHSGEKPYNCLECGRSFAVKGTLKKHIRTHTGERPYICSTCGQAFAQSGTLATHTKIHKSK